MLVPFGLMLAGYICYTLILLPKFFKLISPRYYSIVVNWYRYSDGTLIKLNAAIVKTIAIVTLSGLLPGMSSGILANIFNNLVL